MNAPVRFTRATPLLTLRPSPSLADCRPSQRALIEAQIEGLIAFLDLLDGDADFEPSLGWSWEEAVVGRYLATDDREADAGDMPELVVAP